MKALMATRDSTARTSPSCCAKKASQRREGFEVKALADAMRAVNLKPNDGRQAIEEMRDAGAEIVGDAKKAAGMGE